MSVWDAVVGQREQVSPLRAAVADPAAMIHAWLITGPPGSGRSSAARAFAAALLCANGGCGSCHECSTALGGTHADVAVIATEKVTISIDEVRELVGLSQRAPSGGRWRIIIIEDADRMTERTSNVLLKAIEEPPPRTAWVLCAPSAQDVAVTIRSRCRIVSLRVPPAEVVARLLVERHGIEESLALEAALAAQSHIGIARRLARDPQARARRDQVLALATDVRGVGDAVLAAADLAGVADDDADAATTERDAVERAELMRSLGADDSGRLPPALRAQVRQLEEDQKRRATRAKRDVLDRAIIDLMSLYRDVAAVQMGAVQMGAVQVGAVQTGAHQTSLVNVTHQGMIRELAERMTLAETVECVDALALARERLAANVQPVLALEALVLALRPRPAA
jgi:DNA polymerase-3 subunit delta'